MSGAITQVRPVYQAAYDTLAKLQAELMSYPDDIPDDVGDREHYQELLCLSMPATSLAELRMKALALLDASLNVPGLGELVADIVRLERTATWLAGAPRPFVMPEPPPNGPNPFPNRPVPKPAPKPKGGKHHG